MIWFFLGLLIGWIIGHKGARAVEGFISKALKWSEKKVKTLDEELKD